jgi:glycyl-tRNA synthetase beta chain
LAKYLIEIGTEELPYHFIPGALEQLKNSLSNSLDDNRIDYSEIKTYGTPRRLTVLVEGIAKSQSDIIKEVKGPPAKAAFDENKNPTKATEGFAKKQGINVDDLFTKEENGVEYIFARIEEDGKLTSEVLSKLLPDIILSIQGSHFMRWADLDIKFQRPIRWIVSLLDGNEVKIKIGEIESSRVSRGHRFYPENDVEIYNPDSYFDALYRAKVIVDTEKRKNAVVNAAKEIAASINAVVKIEPELLKEVTNLVEWPVPVLGSFDAKYLEIPDMVNITVMASHQRYFPLYDKSGKLLNNFITTANFIGNDFDNIRRGNERVIKARLDDAIFFYKEDNKKTLEQRVQDLKGITFQRGLGSIYDKVERTREIASYISSQMNLNEEEKANIDRTSLLCKTDLSTSLVFEFTELQGFIGAHYAKLQGENEEVAEGIKEHYYPISSEGEPANTICGQIAGIADKMDTICGVFAIGKIPTGSADPLGLRRASLGIMTTILKKDLNINLSELIKFSISKQPVEVENQDELTAKIKEFMAQRLKVYLNDEYRYDIVDCALFAKNSLSSLIDLKKRLEITKNIVDNENYSHFHDSANRILRLIKESEFKPLPDSNIFVHEIERQLWDCTSGLMDNNLNYNQLSEKLFEAIPTIEEFFDKVLVMDKDDNIKENRISILGNLKAQFLKIGDFSKIIA